MSPTVLGPPLLAFAFVISAVLYFMRSRRRCPYRNPLCRRDRPCLLCYRDLYKNKVVEWKPDE